MKVASENHSYSGFTIVELLIVIVVIAILAAITIVAYNGITNKAQISAVQSALTQANKKLALYMVDNNSYPADSTTFNTLIGSSAATYSNYTVNNTSPTPTFCVTATTGSTSYYITQDGQPYSGSCPNTNGLIGWWKFDGNANDSSGYNNNGAINGASLATGQNALASGAYSFSGSSVQYIDTPSTFAQSVFSVSVWAEPDGTGPGSFDTIISNARDCCSTNSGFQIDYTKTSPYRLTARLWTGGAGPVSNISYTGLVLNSWNYITITYDGTTFKLYYNGVAVASGSYSGSIATPLYNVSIGRMGYTTSSYSFGGLLDDVRIYNRALSASEISAIYSAGAQ